MKKVIIALIIIGVILGWWHWRVSFGTLGSTEEVEEIPSDILEHINAKADLIKVTYPEPLADVVSPLEVRGEARGSWFFEGDFPIVVVDWDGRIISESYASFIHDPNDPESTWMTTEFVPFEGTVEFDLPEGSYSKRGSIIFQKDNPSGLPEHDDALEIPIMFE